MRAGDDAVPLDFLDGSSVLAPMPAGTRPEDVHIEAEYIEPVKEEAPENVSSASPDSLFASLAALGDFSALHTRSRKTWSYSYPAQRKNVQGKAGRCKSSWAEALSCCRERALGPGAAAMDAALARLNRAEEDVAALREAIKVN